MDSHFVEATNGERNWGKFCILRFTDDEWSTISQVDGRPLLAGRGWSREHVLVVDLQTGEGAFFYPAGLHHSDLAKHQIWVCPMFQHAAGEILSGKHDPMDTEALLDFPDAPFEWAGYRRQGPDSELRVAAEALLEQWNQYIGVGDTEGDDDFDAIAELIGKLREALAGTDPT